MVIRIFPIPRRAAPSVATHARSPGAKRRRTPRYGPTARNPLRTRRVRGTRRQH